ncbi:MAG: PASTA domain-containing protein, partial [Flavobacterium sp.]|nr:PASTA domain-containing protein [Flavobacterium sp.]
NLDKKIIKQENSYANYYNISQIKYNLVPNVKGMSGMDAVALLGNLKLKVKVIGIGKVKSQSILPGENIVKSATIVLELS